MKGLRPSCEIRGYAFLGEIWEDFWLLWIGLGVCVTLVRSLSEELGLYKENADNDAPFYSKEERDIRNYCKNNQLWHGNSLDTHYFNTCNPVYGDNSFTVLVGKGLYHGVKDTAVNAKNYVESRVNNTDLLSKDIDGLKNLSQDVYKTVSNYTSSRYANPKLLDKDLKYVKFASTQAKNLVVDSVKDINKLDLRTRYILKGWVLFYTN